MRGGGTARRRCQDGLLVALVQGSAGGFWSLRLWLVKAVPHALNGTNELLIAEDRGDLGS